jgi:hypothetical protein
LKLSVHLLAQGRYWKSGEEIAAELVPPHIAEAYGVPDTGAAGTAELSGPETPGTHVLRASAFKRIGEQGVTVQPGEPTYRRQGKAFIPT